MASKRSPKLQPPAAPASDIFAFVGVRKIIGDPHGRLMQDEVAARIQKLVNVLRHTVGIMDAIDVMASLPRLEGREKKAFILCRDQIREMLDEQMPEWDAVCRAIHEAGEKF